MGGVYGDQEMRRAIPALKAAFDRLHARGDREGAARARRALDIAMGKPRAQWFAEPMPAPAMPELGTSEPNARLESAHNKLVATYVAAKRSGDRATMQKLEAYLSKHGLLPVTPGLDHQQQTPADQPPPAQFSDAVTASGRRYSPRQVAIINSIFSRQQSGVLRKRLLGA